MARTTAARLPPADAHAPGNTLWSVDLLHWRIVADATTDAIYLIDPVEMAIVEMNEAAGRMLGHTRDELLAMPIEQVFCAGRDELRHDWNILIGSPTRSDAYQAVLRRKDSSPIDVEVRRRAVRSGARWLVAKVVRDITAQRAAERVSQRHAVQQGLIAAFGQFALENTRMDELMDETINVVRNGLPCDHCRLLEAGADDDSLTLRAGFNWHSSWANRVTFDATEETEDRFIIGAREVIVVHDFVHQWRYRRSPVLAAHHVRSAVEVLVCGVDGPYGMLGAYARTPGAFTQESANFMKSVAHTLAAAIDRKNAEEKLARMAQYDALTGLPNRTLFLERLWQAISYAERERNPVGVLFVDVDRFKVVNDTLGHDAGDKLLIEVSRRLQSAVRHSDTVGRLGGDEFALVLPHVARFENTATVAAKIVAMMSQPFQIAGEAVFVSASVGISAFPRDGSDPAALLKKADSAMYRAKEMGRNNYQAYLAESEESSDRLRTEALLRGALERNEFVLHYQPKILLETGAISGFEALLRWRHPERGLVRPNEFMAILEDTGLIIPVGAWVIGEVCAQIAAWQSQGVVVRPIAVNLSARQFRQKDLDGMLERTLKAHGVTPALLEVELTESTLIQDLAAAALSLENMKAIGVRIAVDDFGTGYSSLAYLRRLPIDVLKIDRAFVCGIDTDADDATIATAIIGLAQSLKLRVIAEGVETATQLEFLRAHGCNEVQGYYFSHALPADECAQILRDGLPGYPTSKPSTKPIV